MSVTVNKDGKLVVTSTTQYGDAAEELIIRRSSLLDLIANQPDDVGDLTPMYYGIQMLKDLELSYEQIQSVLNK